MEIKDSHLNNIYIISLPSKKMIKGKPLMEELTFYLKKNLKKGYTRESLRWALVNQGYSKIEVDNALKKVDKDLADQAPILKTKPEIEHKIIPIEEPTKKKSFWERLLSD
jgi:argonaute-like protein implicated in RNA metabolism and viral defense